MIKTVTFGYRWEGLALHQWALIHTNLQMVVLPGNRIFEGTWSTLINWGTWNRLPMWCQVGKDDMRLVKRLEELNPNVILCCCYPYKLIPEILSIPKLGCINIHPGKLPEYRGRDPIKAAMDNNERFLYSTIHKMDENFDTGPVLLATGIPNTKDPQQMRSLLVRAGLILLEEYLK